MIIKEGNIAKLGSFKHFQYELDDLPLIVKQELISFITSKLKPKELLESMDAQIILEGYIEVIPVDE